jgi:hypothetical protein
MAFDGRGTQTLRLKLSRAGRRLLVRARRRAPIRLTLQASFNGYWAGRVEAAARRSLRL